MSDLTTFPPMCALPESLTTSADLSKWGKRAIRWCVTALPGLDEARVIAAYREAWSYWAAVCGIEPAYVEGARTSDVLMGAGLIDGRNGTLAWSELPNGSDRQLRQMYDTGERWVVSETPDAASIDLVRVACHEVGHVIGIGHLPAGTGNLMCPAYDPRIRRPQRVDIAEAVARYGPPTPGPIPTPEKVVVEISGVDPGLIVIPGYKLVKAA